MLRERAAAEARNNPAPLHGEVITVAIESDVGRAAMGGVA
jgi:hypothetical protein